MPPWRCGHLVVCIVHHLHLWSRHKIASALSSHCKRHADLQLVVGAIRIRQAAGRIQWAARAVHGRASAWQRASTKHRRAEHRDLPPGYGTARRHATAQAALQGLAGQFVQGWWHAEGADMARARIGPGPVQQRVGACELSGSLQQQNRVGDGNSTVSKMYMQQQICYGHQKKKGCSHAVRVVMRQGRTACGFCLAAHLGYVWGSQQAVLLTHCVATGYWPDLTAARAPRQPASGFSSDIWH